MLMEISKMEQRYDAVIAVVQGGFSITEAAQKFGVSRESVYRWMKRYEEGELEALAEGSHRPKHSPLQTPAEIETRIVEHTFVWATRPSLRAPPRSIRSC